MFNFSYHLEKCQTCDLHKFVPFTIQSKKVGWVTSVVSSLLSSKLPEDFIETEDGLFLRSTLRDFDSRSAALARATDILCDHYKTPMRIENYAVVEKWGDEPLAEIDRCAVPWFGIRGFGVHVNGYVKKPDGLYIWVGERAANRQVDPGKLDNIIGGGLPIGLTVEENLVKESWEEAGLSASVARTAKPAGTLNYMIEKMNGIRNDTIFIYDMELPETTIPNNTDGEVAAFRLLPASEVAEIIHNSERFKFNCAVVIIDFLMRQRHFPETHPEYKSMVRWLEKTRKEPG